MAVLARRASDVRIREVNFSQTIAQNANAIGAMVMVSAQGPVGPRFYSNPEDFLFAYGNPNAAISFDHYCGLDYFKEGNGLWVNRVVETDARMAAAVILLDSVGNTVIRSIPGGISLLELTFPNWDTYVGLGETALYVVYPKLGPGSFANTYALNLTTPNLNPPSAVSGNATPSGTGSIMAGTYVYQVSALSSDGSETLASVPATVIISASSLTHTITLSWQAVDSAVGYRVYGRDSTGTLGLLETVGGSETTFIDDGLTVPDLTKQPTNSIMGLGQLSTKFTLNVYDLSISTGTPLESFPCTTDDNVDETGAQTEISQKVNPFSLYIGIMSNVPTLLETPVLKSVNTKVSLSGGMSGSAPTIGTINQGFNTYINKAQYVIDSFINSGRSVPAIQLNIDRIAQTRNDSVALLDVPSTQQTFSASVDYRNVQLNLNSSYSALFGPDLLESDPINGKYLFIPPSGAMAGLMARTTRVAAPWFSIAGLNRGLLSVLDVRFTYDDGQATQLYNAQVNYMRKFIGQGIAIWEQSTLSAQPSALQFLNVRVLCNVIKRSAYNYLLYGLQEQNDDILKLQLVNGFKEYLDTIKAGRGIFSYDIICDARNNPPALANSGILAIAIIIVPILAVREIQLTLGISKQGLQISEGLIASL